MESTVVTPAVVENKNRPTINVNNTKTNTDPGNTYLTKNEFYEWMDAFEKRFEAKLDAKFDEKLAPIKDTLKKLEGFQDNESFAIEYELQTTLRTYLIKSNPRSQVKHYPMNNIYDPFTYKEITELDAAFLLSEVERKPDYSRLTSNGRSLPRPSETPYSPDKSKHFILAEAKHYINTNKIAYKLWQFDKIIASFHVANQLGSGHIVDGVHPKFSKCVERNKYLGEITRTTLYFGAAYWQPNMFDKFRAAVTRYKAFAEQFNSADPSDKINLYNGIKDIEYVWYKNTDVSGCAPPVRDLSDEQIIALESIDGALAHVEFIFPSGGRFTVENMDGPVGAATVALGGSRKTRRNRGEN